MVKGKVRKQHMDQCTESMSDVSYSIYYSILYFRIFIIIQTFLFLSLKACVGSELIYSYEFSLCSSLSRRDLEMNRSGTMINAKTLRCVGFLLFNVSLPLSLPLSI